MIKEILKRAFIAIGIANLVCIAVTFIVYISGADLSGFDAVQSMKNHLAYSLIGAASGGAGVLFNVKSFSLLKATVIHFFIILAAYILGYFMAWGFPESGAKLLIPIASFAGMYLITWFAVYFAVKASVKKINEKLNK